jgi:predicted house-cleaning noncanonical NTP pyrophosphatase (MazG superfamily)
MSEINIFEVASIQKFRFATVKGEVTTEALWDMPLQSKNQFDLDTVAKNVSAALKSVTEESFVATTSNPAKEKLSIMLEVVKHIIACKLKANEERLAAAVKAAKREKLVAILGEKQDEALKAMTPEELAAQIAALG